MANAYRISLPRPLLTGSIALESSKSISNRALIINSLCNEDIKINRLSTSDDTKALAHMLSTESSTLSAGHAGSSYRFMVARACLLNREVTLDGSEQLRRRQIGPLVNALRELGADISYLNKEGFPPVQIKPYATFGQQKNEIHLQAGISSQYVSALLLIAPYLKNGLIIHLIHDPVSKPYIRMTLNMMKWFGIDHSWENDTIRILPGEYTAREFTVEGDWSAASYFFSMVALADESKIEIEGLHSESIQGDAVVQEIYELLGVEATFIERGLFLAKKNTGPLSREMQYDFTDCPDLAQTVMVTLAGLGIKGHLKGLKTLRIKETDRISAMQTELAKVKTTIEVKEENSAMSCVLYGKAKWKDKAKFETYEDHRMAMALTPLACLHPILIRQPDVVTKSYPGFWKDISKIGFKIER